MDVNLPEKAAPQRRKTDETLHGAGGGTGSHPTGTTDLLFVCFGRF